MRGTAYVSVSVHWLVLDDTGGNEGRGGLPNVSRQGCGSGRGVEASEGRGGREGGCSTAM